MVILHAQDTSRKSSTLRFNGFCSIKVLEKVNNPPTSTTTAGFNSTTLGRYLTAGIHWFSEVAIEFFLSLLVVLMWIFFLSLKLKGTHKWKQQQQTLCGSNILSRWGGGRRSCQWEEEGEVGQNNRDKHGCQFHRLFINTWNVVQSNWVLSVGTVLSFLSPQYESHLCASVGFRKFQRGLSGWMKRGSDFLHFIEAYIIFLLPVKQNVFSTESLVLVMIKKKENKTKTRKQKSSGPIHDIADTAAWLPCCWSAGLGKLDHWNNGRMDTHGIKNEGLDFSQKWHWRNVSVGFFFGERWLLEKIKHTHTHNNNFKSRFLFLQETDGSNFKAELLVWSTNIHRSDINDRQARRFWCLVVNDCLAPCSGVWLKEEEKKEESVSI